MSKKTINNLLSKEKKVFLANVKKYERIINCSEVIENGGVSGRTDYEQCASNMQVDVGIEHFNGPIPSSSMKKDTPSLLGVIIDNQNKILGNQDAMNQKLQGIENRLAILEANNTDIINHRSEAMAQNTLMRECKVLIKRMHKSLCRMTGETDDETAIEIASSLPISTIFGCIEMEEKLQRHEYEMSMKAHLFKLKGNSGSLDYVLRNLFTDDFCYLCNFDGKFGKVSLNELNLINQTLFDVFQNEGRQEFNRGLKRYVDLSHNRHRQKQHHGVKKTKRKQ